MSSLRGLLRNALLDTIKATLVGAPLIALFVTAAYGLRTLVLSASNEHEVEAVGGLVLIFMTALLTSLVFGLIPAAFSAVLYNVALMRSATMKLDRLRRICVAAAIGGVCSGLLVYIAIISDGTFTSPPAPYVVALGIGAAGCVSGVVVGSRKPRESIDRVA